MYNLGVLLQERGDLNGADTWYRKAADLGDTGAVCNLGVLLQATSTAPRPGGPKPPTSATPARCTTLVSS